MDTTHYETGKLGLSTPEIESEMEEIRKAVMARDEEAARNGIAYFYLHTPREIHRTSVLNAMRMATSCLVSAPASPSTKAPPNSAPPTRSPTPSWTPSGRRRPSASSRPASSTTRYPRTKTGDQSTESAGSPPYRRGSGNPGNPRG